MNQFLLDNPTFDLEALLSSQTKYYRDYINRGLRSMREDNSDCSDASSRCEHWDSLYVISMCRVPYFMHACDSVCVPACIRSTYLCPLSVPVYPYTMCTQISEVTNAALCVCVCVCVYVCVYVCVCVVGLSSSMIDCRQCMAVVVGSLCSSFRCHYIHNLFFSPFA